ncbi:MAG TPA: FecR domain-containing protein [Candidatus Obscuribacterales bacterium]
MANLLKSVVLACCLLVTGLDTTFVQASSLSGVEAAVLQEAHGHVYKRAFKDWEREIWDDPQPATVGDALTEGMQIGTGDSSWAQVTWPNVSTRAWANTLYAIAPNKRLVYLTSGEMLYHLDKKRKDSDSYFVWTKLLSARIRGTTVLFQSTPEMSRVTVLEGTIEVLNRVDHSSITLKPGVVYEIKRKGGESGLPPAATNNVVAPAATNNVVAPVATNTLTDVVAATGKPVVLFETGQTISSLLPVDTGKLLAMPILTSLTEPLSSLPLVRTAMSAVDSLLGGALTLPIEQKLLKRSVEILAVPMRLSYTTTNDALAALSLPQAAIQYFPPSAVTGGMNMDLTALRHEGIVPSQLQNIAGATGNVGCASMASVSALSGLSGITAGGATMSAISGVSGIAAMPNLSGVSSALLTPTAAMVPVSAPTVGTALITGVVPQATSPPVTSLISGTTSLLNTTTNTVTNTLNNTLSGVRSLLGR